MYSVWFISWFILLYSLMWAFYCMRSNRAIISAAPEEPFILHCLSLSPSLWLEHTGARSLSTDLAAWRGSCVSTQQEKNHMEFLLLPVAGSAFKDAEGVCVCESVKENIHLYYCKDRAKTLTLILVSLQGCWSIN